MTIVINNGLSIHELDTLQVVTKGEAVKLSPGLADSLLKLGYTPEAVLMGYSGKVGIHLGNFRHMQQATDFMRIVAKRINEGRLLDVNEIALELGGTVYFT